MATFKRVGLINTFWDKMTRGVTANGLPESHAAALAMLVYVLTWVKCHYPEMFATALLNSQPMDFYGPPPQIVRDAR